MGRKALSAPDGFKKCTACGEVKPATREFWHYQEKGHLGFAARCCPCKMIEIARTNTPERKKAYYEANKTTILPKLNASAKARRAANPREVRAVADAWREQNRPEIRRKHKDWSDQNRAAVRMAKRVSQAKRRAASDSRGHHTQDDIRRLLSGQKGCCWWCRKPLKDFHVDHRIPLSRGGSNCAENLVIACPACNLSRRDKMPWEWKAPRLL